MTRVLFWNIESFGINKIFSASRKRPRGKGGLSDAQAAIDRCNTVRAVVDATIPDIIVIIETGSGDNAPNYLATQTSGMDALVWLQALLNSQAYLAVTPGGWNVVPPLFVGAGGRAETVGILYRRQDNAGTVLRYFTGPNVWTGGYAGFSRNPVTGAVPAAYPADPGLDINGMLVPAGVGGGVVRAIPAGALHNGGRNENVVAARVDFTNPAGAAVAFAGLRQPTMATFTEANAAGAVQRNLSLFAIHSPPQGAAATAYMATLATLADIVNPLGANEQRVVGGDFNLNLFAANGTYSGAYDPLLPAGGHDYRLLVSPTAAGVPTNLDQYMGYFSTHIRGQVSSKASRFLWSDVRGARLSYYPGYGYVGSNFVRAPFYAIDNILVWPYQGGLNYDTTIMNTVVGTPLDAAGVVPDNPPVGTAVMGSRFQAPPAAGWPEQPTAADYPGVGGANRLIGWQNYGHIRNTSDHFAIFAEV